MTPPNKQPSITDADRDAAESAGEMYTRLGMDGDLWAKEFIKRWSGQVIGEDEAVDAAFMRAWFCSSIMAGYDRGVNHERAKVDELVRAAKNLGLQCVNIGNYGPLGLSPGECRCSTCEMKKALKQYSGRSG